MIVFRFKEGVIFMNQMLSKKHL